MDDRSDAQPKQEAPSTRAALNRIRRVTFFVALIGLALFAVGAWWWITSAATFLFRDGALVIPLPMKANENGAAMMLGGAFIVACAVVVRVLAGRCNACGYRLSRPFSCGSGPMSVSRKLRFCPHCAASID